MTAPEAPPLLPILAPVDALSHLLTRIAMVLAYALIGSMMFEVVARYGFGRPTIWAFDISYMLNGGLFLLGIGWTLRQGKHVRIDFLASLMPPRVQHGVLALVYALLVLPPVTWLAWVAIRTALRAHATGELEAVSPWAPLMWPFYGVMALGLLGFALQLLAETLRHAARALARS